MNSGTEIRSFAEHIKNSQLFREYHSALEGSLQTIHWAALRYGEYFRLQSEYLPGCAIGRWQVKLDSIDYLIYLQKNPPIYLAQVAFECIQHCKNAFDQIVYNAVLHNGAFRSKKKIYFPWCDTQKVFRGKLQEYPPEISTTLNKFSDFATLEAIHWQDKTIRNMAALANSKHTFSLSVIPDYNTSLTMNSIFSTGKINSSKKYFTNRKIENLEVRREAVVHRLPLDLYGDLFANTDARIVPKNYSMQHSTNFSNDLELFIMAAESVATEFNRLLSQ